MNTIKYSDGRTDTRETIEEAIEAIRKKYPDAVFFDRNGEEAELIQTTEEILAWETEEASIGDDGSQAIAIIREEE